MPNTTELKDVPRDRVGNQVQQAIHAGATRVECERQPGADERWTIRAS